MKNKILLNITNPCHEKWEGLTPTTHGGFCTSCSKVVTDFSTMSDAEIFDYFSNRPDKTCGRFRADQLKVYVKPLPSINPGISLLKVGFVSLLFIFLSKPGTAQTIQEKAKTEIVQGQAIDQNKPAQSGYLVKGVVKSKEDGLPLPGVNIWLKDSQTGTVSDANGQFVFPRQLKAGDVLVFSFIGLLKTEFMVTNDPKGMGEVTLDMALDAYTVLGEVSADGPYTEKQSSLRKLWAKVKNVF